MMMVTMAQGARTGTACTLTCIDHCIIVYDTHSLTVTVLTHLQYINTVTKYKIKKAFLPVSVTDCQCQCHAGIYLFQIQKYFLVYCP